MQAGGGAEQKVEADAGTGANAGAGVRRTTAHISLTNSVPMFNTLFDIEGSKNLIKDFKKKNHESFKGKF